MPEFGSSGSVRGAANNGRPYRNRRTTAPARDQHGRWVVPILVPIRRVLKLRPAVFGCLTPF